MSPLTAKLKCPHGNGKHTHGAEAVAEVAFDQKSKRVRSQKSTTILSKVETRPFIFF